MNENTTEPKYQKLVKQMKAYIQENMKTNQKILSEREIAQRLSISRYTVRKALDELEKKGYIYKVHGKGTFVSEKSVPTALNEIYSFTEQMEQLGKKPKMELLEFKVFTPNQELASKLHVATQDKVIKLKYLRTADDVPMMIEETYLPYSKFPTLTVDALSKNSLYSIMKTEFNQSIHVVSESMRASLISSNEAKLLKIEDGSPCLNVRRTSFNKLNEPIEFTSCIARGDQFVYNCKYIHQD